MLQTLRQRTAPTLAQLKKIMDIERARQLPHDRHDKITQQNKSADVEGETYDVDFTRSQELEGKVARQVWKAYQALHAQHTELREHLFKMRLELDEAPRTELIRHGCRQPKVDVTEIAARAARVLAKTSGSQEVPTSELVDMVVKSIKMEKEENENSLAPTIPGVPPDQGSGERQLSQGLAAIWEEAGLEGLRTPPHRMTHNVSPQFQRDQQVLPVPNGLPKVSLPNSTNKPTVNIATATTRFAILGQMEDSSSRIRLVLHGEQKQMHTYEN